MPIGIRGDIMKNKTIQPICLVMAILLFLAGGVTFDTALADAVTPYQKGSIEGHLTAVDETGIQIEEYDGTVHGLSFAANAAFSIDTIPVSIGDFKSGMEVYATLSGKSVATLEGYSTETTAFIPAGSKMRVGTVKKIDRDQLTLYLPYGKEETYSTSALTIALKDGKNVSLDVLYEGDTVKLYFDDMYTTQISRLEIQNDAVNVKGLYRGVLAVANPFQNNATLTNLEVFKNGKWEAVASSKTMAYSASTAAYIGGQKMSLPNLKYYKGKTAYMVLKDFFGMDRIEKVVVKSDYESTFFDKIIDINWYSEMFKLENNKNFTFNPGTIIIKNGRLVDSYALEDEADAFIVGDGTGSKLMANVVCVYNEDVNNSNIGQHYIYEGTLDEILSDRLKLKDFCILDKHEWESFNDEKELYLDNDTVIYDAEEDKNITLEEFYSGDYAVDEDSDYADDNDLKDWYGYIYTDGDRVTSIVTSKTRDSLLSQTISIGTVEYTEDNSLVGWRVSMQDTKDWSRRKEAWMDRSTSTLVMLQDALIIKEGQTITPEDLKADDRLYMVRDGVRAKVVIVK